MPPSFYQMRQCENPACGLRYPLTGSHPFGERCPSCLGPTRVALERKLGAELPSALDPSPKGRGEIRVDALLDNVRSAWNVGAIFRTADAFGVGRLHLCGITSTPENPSVRKTALGADSSVAWDYAKNALTLAEKLKSEGVLLWALEQDERGKSIYDLRFQIDDWITGLKTNFAPIVLIVGNEITGVDPALLDLCDKILYIPMRGIKRSLNVEVAFGVAASLLVH